MDEKVKLVTRYQIGITAGDRMYHVREDDWEEFKTAVKNMEEEFFLVKDETETPKTESPPPITDPSPDTPTSSDVLKCKTCDGETLPERKFTGKDGRSWWVRDCATAKSAGDFSHKSPMRPAT